MKTILLLLLSLPLTAQTPYQFPAPSAAKYATAPATCAPGATYFNTATNTEHLCIAANVWGKRIVADANNNVAMRTTVLGPLTIAAGANQLPTAASSNGYISVVTDAVNGSDCVTGGGTAVALCRSNGSVWASIGGGGGWMTYTIPYTHAGFKVASTTATITLQALPANSIISGLAMETSVAFAGTGITAATCQLQSSVAGTVYAPAYDIKAAVSDTNLYTDGGAFTARKTAHSINLVCTSNVNWGDGTNSVLSAGSLTVDLNWAVRR